MLNSIGNDIVFIKNILAGMFFSPLQEKIFKDSVDKVLIVSPFVHSLIIIKPEIIKDLVVNGSLFESYTLQKYIEEIAHSFSSISTESDLIKSLRYYRNRAMVRIAWRDIAGWAPIDETLRDTSYLAEAIICETIDYLFQEACKTKGTPLNRSGQIQRLVIIGMGKLGAWELNYSSDIDLIFAYEDDGVLGEKRSISYSEFYSKIIHSFIKVIDSKTQDGFVFRVDTRLRPYGDSGPIIMSYDGMEIYYQTQAREWERYAMVKARVFSHDQSAGNKLQAIITPFIYRRYLDFRAIEELRQLKSKIEIELRRKDRADNIKLGPGGIREIEFIGQVFQLIRGGQEKSLRERSILCVLNAVGDLGYLPQHIILKLQDGYNFLRLVENRIQQYSDSQCHDLPLNYPQRYSLVQAFNLNSWNDFIDKLDVTRKFIHEIFTQVFQSPQILTEGDLFFDWCDSDVASLTDQLKAIGFSSCEMILDLLISFQCTYSIRKISSRGSIELNKILPMFLRAIVKQKNPVETFSRILKLLEAIAGRSVYLSLLAENPLALSQLVKLSTSSSWIVNFISKYPILLDELLDPRSLYAKISHESITKELKYRISTIEVDDTEEFLNTLRHFKQAYVLKIAVADIMDSIPIMIVSDYLTWLSEVLVSCVLEHSWKLTVDRYGFPPGCSTSSIFGFGVLAYGKMGGRELSYTSDLDLVFLYGGVHDETPTVGNLPISCAEFYARVVKRMVSIFTTQIMSGILYDIDLRLRPSGNSGLLVSSIQSYEKYQIQSAWTWEQQALVRARFIAGDPWIASQFSEIRHLSLCRKRDCNLLRHDVADMRNKMREKLELKVPGKFDLKQAKGGIADIEFIVQFGVLNGSHDNPNLTQWTDVVRLLDCLHESGFLSLDESTLLKEAYCIFRKETHRAALLERSPTVLEEDFAEIRSRVLDIWCAKIGIY